MKQSILDIEDHKMIVLVKGAIIWLLSTRVRLNILLPCIYKFRSLAAQELGF